MLIGNLYTVYTVLLYTFIVSELTFCITVCLGEKKSKQAYCEQKPYWSNYKNHRNDQGIFSKVELALDHSQLVLLLNRGKVCHKITF